MTIRSVFTSYAQRKFIRGEQSHRISNYIHLKALVKSLGHFRSGKQWPVTGLYFILPDLGLCANSQKWPAAAGKAAFCLNRLTILKEDIILTSAS